jgi:hypothetical protein
MLLVARMQERIKRAGEGTNGILECKILFENAHRTYVAIVLFQTGMGITIASSAREAITPTHSALVFNITELVAPACACNLHLDAWSSSCARGLLILEEVRVRCNAFVDAFRKPSNCLQCLDALHG